MSCCGPQGCQNFDDEREGISDEDLARFGGDDIDCPKCGASLYHDASQCSKCGHAFMDEERAVGTPTWVPLTAIALVAGIVLLFML